MAHQDKAREAYAGLDLLSTAVLLLNERSEVIHANPAAENQLAASARSLSRRTLAEVLGTSNELARAIDNALVNNWGYTGQNLELRRPGGESLRADCTVTPLVLARGGARLLLELRPVDQQLRLDHEEQLLAQQAANRELLRNLAHEIKNPLGGIRGAAQLLERELPQAELREYTQVIIKETDRLQDLMARLLSPHRAMQPAPVNIHEVLERVRSILLAEFPQELEIRRDYDTSLPELVADREQLIQAILNVARNAAQAMAGKGRIVLRTRAQRQATLLKRRYRLALEVQVIDNGPGIPEHIREHIFYPLVSGREGGSGLGLAIAQGFVQQHHGSIEVDSRPGHTCFTMRLPLSAPTRKEAT